jgi:hypothetical protein
MIVVNDIRMPILTENHFPILDCYLATDTNHLRTINNLLNIPYNFIR